MAKRKFKAESERLLDLMINSIYTHKEIFLRELISNASDAIDKLYCKILVDKVSGISRDDFYIKLRADKDARTLTIEDNGIGMTKEELEKNLGTIAKSGSLGFEAEGEAKDEIDIIGQFGVGFYSAFMVSEEVDVKSKAYGEEAAYEWRSKGVEGYSIKEIEKEASGTVITLKIKENSEEENYDDYLSPYRIQGLVKQYSDFIRYPIRMVLEDEETTLNSMVPLWKRAKKDITDEDYANFYKDKWNDMEDPIKVVHTAVEGVVSYDALVFVPSKAPFNYYTKEYERGLQLYSSGVMIMDKCSDLIPDYFAFVRGVVDSQDLSLNISREMLQHDRQLRAIAQRLEKKIKSELENMMKNQREDYEKFWTNFGLQLKFGLYDNFGMNKDKLKDLILFTSSKESKLVSLREYVDGMKEDQEYIYYAAGSDVDKIERQPQVELFKEEGVEVLYLTDDVDEFALRILVEYEGKQFKSASDSEAGEADDGNKELIEFIEESLGDKVSGVRFSQRLKSYPVRLSSGDGISLEMEKVLNAMPNDEKVKADHILEINSEHAIMKTLESAFETDKDRVKEYARLLYDQALLIEGLPIDDPIDFSNSVCELMKGRV